MKKIFVTGGTGFIGSRIVDRLRREPETTIYVLSRKRKKNFDNIKYVEGDISDERFLSSVLSDLQPDTLLHFAWDVQASDYVSSDANYLWVRWSELMIRNFLENGGKHVIAAGTCFEYDITRMTPHQEDETPRPNTIYGKCKLLTKKKIESLCNEFRARFVWGRIFYPYGEGEDDRKLMTAARNTLMEGKVFLCRNPENIVDYIHVDDVANIFVRFLLDDKAKGVVNVGTGDGKRIRDILTCIAKKYKKENLLQFEKQENQYCIIANPEKLKKILGGCFHERRSYFLEDGLNRENSSSAHKN